MHRDQPKQNGLSTSRTFRASGRTLRVSDGRRLYVRRGDAGADEAERNRQLDHRPATLAGTHQEPVLRTVQLLEPRARVGEPDSAPARRARRVRINARTVVLDG